MKKSNPGAWAFMIFSAFMAVVYIALGGLLLLNYAPGLLPPPYAQIMGGLVALYGMFRFWREWVKFRSTDEDRGRHQF